MRNEGRFQPLCLAVQVSPRN
ncbi:unnamed protein product [Cyprideis torosa]|uniref:Uncharacterized protein n=1 Tax=Cyprideis torosa TaxID=163714 RepID=A0A7R8WRD7_9CRUS|nr:unnamed protein product [Cyprideis torosa]CAG0908632.1 unnamed protein product [Cyprideis torosa]